MSLRRTDGTRVGATIGYFRGELIRQIACLSGKASELFSEGIQTLDASVVFLGGLTSGMLHHSLSASDPLESSGVHIGDRPETVVFQLEQPIRMIKRLGNAHEGIGRMAHLGSVSRPQFPGELSSTIASIIPTFQGAR